MDEEFEDALERVLGLCEWCQRYPLDNWGGEKAANLCRDLGVVHKGIYALLLENERLRSCRAVAAGSVDAKNDAQASAITPP